MSDVAGLNFADQLLAAVEEKRSHVVVGLDPDYPQLPSDLREKHEALGYDSPAKLRAACYREFLFALLEALTDQVVAVKPQLAHYEVLGAAGWELYQELVGKAHQLGYLVVADAKRGDIGSTAEAYARAHLDIAGADSMTVNPYFGKDGLGPFLDRARAGKGLFVLLKTSNPSSADLQDLELQSGKRLYEHLARLLLEWGSTSVGAGGYSSVGAVVGATHPEQARQLRRLLPGVPFLVPGYGAQGGRASDLEGVFDEQGRGVVVNSARAILYAYKNSSLGWIDAARAEAEQMRRELWRVARGRL